MFIAKREEEVQEQLNNYKRKSFLQVDNLLGGITAWSTAGKELHQ